MRSTDKITQEAEDALQDLSHELEQIAEQIRSRAYRGRPVGGLSSPTEALRQITQRVEALTHCEP